MHCDQRFTGEPHLIYLNYYTGSTRVQFRYVICPTSLEALVDEWLGKAEHRDGDGVWAEPDEEETLDGLLVPVDELPTAFTRKKVS